MIDLKTLDIWGSGLQKAVSIARRLGKSHHTTDERLTVRLRLIRPAPPNYKAAVKIEK